MTRSSSSVTLVRCNKEKCARSASACLKTPKTAESAGVAAFRKVADSSERTITTQDMLQPVYLKTPICSAWRYSGRRTSKALNQYIGIDENHPVQRFQPWDRRSRANSTPSSISRRSRHIPKNSESASSLIVDAEEESEEETKRTISAGPVGMSAGSRMRSSRFAGMSALRLTILPML